MSDQRLLGVGCNFGQRNYAKYIFPPEFYINTIFCMVILMKYSFIFYITIYSMCFSLNEVLNSILYIIKIRDKYVLVIFWSLQQPVLAYGPICIYSTADNFIDKDHMLFTYYLSIIWQIMVKKTKYMYYNNFWFAYCNRNQVKL